MATIPATEIYYRRKGQGASDWVQDDTDVTGAPVGELLEWLSVAPSKVRTKALSIPAAMNNYYAIIDGDSLSSSQLISSTATNRERRATGYLTYTQALCYQMFNMKFSASFGTSGHKIADMLTGQATAISNLEANDGRAVFLCLGTNDVEDVGTSIGTLTTSYTTLIQAYLEATTLPYVFVGLPTVRGDWELDTEGNRATFVSRLHAIRAALTTICNTTLASHKLIMWDAFDEMVDTTITNATNGLTYYPLANMLQTDGVHLSATGGYLFGRACANKVKATPLWKTPVALPNATGAENTNTTMAGTDGTVGTGVTGQVASACYANRATGDATCVASKVTQTIFGQEMTCQKLVITGGASTSEIQFYIQYAELTGASYPYSGTQGVEMVVPVRIEGANDVSQCYIYSRADVSTTYATKDGIIPTSCGNFQELDDVDLLYKTEPLDVADGNPTRQQMLLRTEVLAGGSVTVYIGPSYYKKANA